jgi:5-(carboxyamino)imidazole ribonucleotide synthase
MTVLLIVLVLVVFNGFFALSEMAVITSRKGRLRELARDSRGARKALERLNYVGVLAIELFEANGELLVNEMAPRVHNSGHWTIEGAATSQFENHMRAVAGLPLGSTEAVGHSVMLNLIGTLPNIEEVLKIPGAHVHLYGKTPRANRKLGHITLHRTDEAELTELAGRLAALID